MAFKLLKHTQGYIDGAWRAAASGATHTVRNPATGEPLADVPVMDAAEARIAVESAARVMASPPTIAQRRQWVRGVERLLLEHKDELARVITAEHGKPLKEAAVEVEYTAGFFRFFAEQIDRLEPHTLDRKPRNCTWTVHYRPAGVAGLITPCHFPLAMMGKKLAPAMAAGCASVTRPSIQAPLSCVALWHLLERLDLPKGFANLLIGKAGPIGDVLCSHPAVRIISFTGSTEVGKVLLSKTAPHVKRMSLELGGNAPFIVFHDADIGAAADGLLANKFRAAGQTCVCANRVYVHHDVLEPFTQAVVERVKKLKVGNGMDPGTDIGPLINRDAFDKVASHVRDALERGATLATGGAPDQRPEHDWGCFFPPTVLTGVRPEMLVCREETFGPVVAISSFNDEREAIDAANSTPFGLAGYVYTTDAERAQRVAAAIQFGHVGINTGTGPTPETPFGGMKESGFGREGGVEGLMEFTEPQVVVRG